MTKEPPTKICYKCQQPITGPMGRINSELYCEACAREELTQNHD